MWVAERGRSEWRHAPLVDRGRVAKRAAMTAPPATYHVRRPDLADSAASADNAAGLDRCSSRAEHTSCNGQRVRFWSEPPPAAAWPLRSNLLPCCLPLSDFQAHEISPGICNLRTVYQFWPKVDNLTTCSQRDHNLFRAPFFVTDLKFDLLTLAFSACDRPQRS